MDVPRIFFHIEIPTFVAHLSTEPSWTNAPEAAVNEKVCSASCIFYTRRTAARILQWKVKLRNENHITIRRFKAGQCKSSWKSYFGLLVLVD